MYSQSIIATLLLTVGLTAAVPTGLHLTASLPAGVLVARQAAQPTAADANCAQAMILAQGIAVNIADQQQELATANAMATQLMAKTVDPNAWASSRTSLLQFVNNGIAIREANQLITPQQNKAAAGTAIVANAQLGELNLATGLTATGGDNVAANMKSIQMLQMGFSGGIMQNMKNMADVSLLPSSFQPPRFAIHDTDLS